MLEEIGEESDDDSDRGRSGLGFPVGTEDDDSSDDEDNLIGQGMSDDEGCKRIRLSSSRTPGHHHHDDSIQMNTITLMILIWMIRTWVILMDEMMMESGMGDDDDWNDQGAGDHGTHNNGASDNLMDFMDFNGGSMRIIRSGSHHHHRHHRQHGGRQDLNAILHGLESRGSKWNYSPATASYSGQLRFERTAGLHP